MGFDFRVFGDDELQPEFVEWLVDEQSVKVQRHFNKLWEYYCNRSSEGLPAGCGNEADLGRCYVQGQEYGLPGRITGMKRNVGSDIFGGQQIGDVQRKEVVIENDIGWRINAAVDFLFGKPISFVSRSPDGRKRSEIEEIINGVFAANGGIGFFQDMAVLGGVYGFVDCFIRPGERVTRGISYSSSLNIPSNFSDVLSIARSVDLELIEAARALPILEEDDYRQIRYYIQHFHQRKNRVDSRNSFLSRIFSSWGAGADKRATAVVTEITSANGWQRYEDRELVGEGSFDWGFLPVVHIQNMAQPYYYEGLSDVEPLIPLQDELNTRLSDRASRITFQSFKMYLGKGIEGFENRPVSPGRMWCTDNPDASIEEFGGDRASPSEEMHISEIREAIDKVSGVTPLVAGVLKNKLGNLTSAVALKLTLMGMLSKTERKRFTYGEGLKDICRKVLGILDKSGVYRTEPEERELDIIFPSPLPENMLEKLKEAQMKKELGVGQEQLLRELGYETKAQSQIEG